MFLTSSDGFLHKFNTRIGRCFLKKGGVELLRNKCAKGWFLERNSEYCGSGREGGRWVVTRRSVVYYYRSE